MKAKMISNGQELPIWKELTTLLVIRSLVIFLLVRLVISIFGFDDEIMIQIEQVTIHSLTLNVLIKSHTVLLKQTEDGNIPD